MQSSLPSIDEPASFSIFYLAPETRARSLKNALTIAEKLHPKVEPVYAEFFHADILDPNFKTDSVENIQRFIHNLLGYYVIMEGIFFYAGFAMMLNLKRHNKMEGVGEQFQYVLRDESIHLAFGADLINTVVAENPEVWTESFKEDLTAKIKKAVELECAYAADALPRGILGMNSEIVKQYMEYIGDRRLERIGLKVQYNTANPFPWMSEIMDLRKEKNFFETRVTEYKQGGALQW